MFDALIKVGGSLWNYEADLRAAAAVWTTLAAEYRLLLFPGGGPFADQVRAVDARFHLSDDAAHWMAILAMDQYGYLLADVVSGAVLVRSLDAAAKTCTRGRVAILAPSELFLQADPLPHSWQVTSDSLAAWLAGYAGIRRLVLLKAVAGVYHNEPRTGTASLLREVSRYTIMNCNVVDSYFARVVPLNTECWIIDGRRPQRLAKLLRHGKTLGTRVV